MLHIHYYILLLEKHAAISDKMNNYELMNRNKLNVSPYIDLDCFLMNILISEYSSYSKVFCHKSFPQG